MKQTMKALATAVVAGSIFFGMITPVSADTNFADYSDCMSAIEFTADYGQTKGLTPEVIRFVLNELMKKDGYKPGKTPVISNNCWKFINEVSKKLFGFGIPGQKKNHMELNASKNWNQVSYTLSQSASNLTVDSLRELFMKSATGDIVQMDYTQTYKNNSDSLHVMMVYSVSSTGVVFYHAGSSVYFGRSNSKNPLYGKTGREVTYEELYSYLKKSDDGISVYRAKNVVAEDSTVSTDPITTEPTTPNSRIYTTRDFKFPNNICLAYKKSFGLRGDLYSTAGFDHVECKLYVKDYWGNYVEYTDFNYYTNLSGQKEYSVNKTKGSCGIPLNDKMVFNRLYRSDYSIRFKAVDIYGKTWTSEYYFSIK